MSYIMTVIIPVSFHENNWQSLGLVLAATHDQTTRNGAFSFFEVYFIGANNEHERQFHLSDLSSIDCFHWTTSERQNRAYQMNLGASTAKGELLLFLHADSSIDVCLLNSYLKCYQSFSSKKSKAIYYSKLRFLNDGPRFCIINAYLANLRSFWFSLPFGDQGLMIPSSMFFSLGQFSVDSTLPEDFDFVLRAKHQKFILKKTPCTISTSARTYKKGWLKTSFHHIKITVFGHLHMIKSLKQR